MSNLHLRPNPNFVRKDNREARRKWAEALIATHKAPNKKQASGSMYYRAGKYHFYCCLMVGHLAFNGKGDTRDDGLPHTRSPFCKAIGIPGHMGIDDDYDPIIARQFEGDVLLASEVSAADLNDHHMLTFAQIAKLVYPEMHRKGANSMRVTPSS